MTQERKKQLAILLGSLLVTGLLIFATINLHRWYQAGGMSEGSIAVRSLSLREAPPAVQDAAIRLMGSRAAYAMESGSVTYLILSTGPSGERLRLKGAHRDPRGSEDVWMEYQSDPAGDRLVLAAINMSLGSTRSLRLAVDGVIGEIPMIINTHNLPLTALPEHESLVVTVPAQGLRLVGSGVEVSGFARLPAGNLSIQIFAAGKGRILGEIESVQVAARSPDWGSFRAMVPLSVPQGVVEGLILVYDRQSGAKLAIPVRFGTK